MTELPAAPVLALMALGVILAVLGSAAKSTAVQATGIALIFLATAAMVVGAYLAFQSEEEDPRPSPGRSQVVTVTAA